MKEQKKKLNSELELPKQPLKCKGCFWGNGERQSSFVICRSVFWRKVILKGVIV